MRDGSNYRGVSSRLVPPGPLSAPRIPSHTREFAAYRGCTDGGCSHAATPRTVDKKSIPFQPLVTVLGSSSSEDVIQASDLWLRGQDNTYHIQVSLNAISNCTLVLESCLTVEGPWSTVTSYAAATQTMAVISSEGGSTKFSGLVRWRIEKDVSDWSTCFQLKAMPGQSVTDVVESPRRA